MSFITATPLGGSSPFGDGYGSFTGGGSFTIASDVPIGTAILVCVMTEFGSSSTITDSKNNTYNLLSQTAIGGGLMQVYGTITQQPMWSGQDNAPPGPDSEGASTPDTIGFTVNGGVTIPNGPGATIGPGDAAICFAVAVSNCTLTVETSASGAGANVGSGSPNVHGAAFFGFTGYNNTTTGTSDDFGVTGIGGWDCPLTGDQFNLQAPGNAGFFGIFGSEIFSHSAVDYNTSFDGNGSVASIVIGLQPIQVTGTMAATDNPDRCINPSLLSRTGYGIYGVVESDPVPPLQPPGPWYFAYIDDESVAFDPLVHCRMDEQIFNFEIKWAENQIPTFTMDILNPRVGLLNADRKQWAIFSYQPPTQQAIDNINNTYGTNYQIGDVIPLFKGVLVGIPSDMFDEIITVVFNARSAAYIEQKQAIAEQLRYANNGENYDAVFIDESKADDPDAILEGWSALYQVDRVSLDVSASDVLQGEGITVTFGEEMALYENLKFILGECPLYNVQVQAQVKWTQRCIGYLTGPSANIISYTGGSFKSDWPKPGASLGGGWKCEFSYVVDILDTDHAHTYSPSYHWEAPPNNTSAVQPHDCSPQSISYSATLTGWPGIMVPGSKGAIVQVGFCAPEGFTDNNGKPIQINIPAKLNAHGQTALLWILNCYWTLRYDAKRDYSEMLIMDIVANLQSTLVSPTVDESTQLLKVPGRDVGQPLVQAYAWSDFSGSYVPPGTIIYNNDPTTPGGRSYQVNINPNGGVAGTAIPVFSDVPGTQTVDGTVLWSSLGESLPNVVGEWTPATPIAAGTIMVMEPKGFDPDTGDMENTGASCFALCIQGGTTNDTYTEFTYLPTMGNNDDLPPLPIPFAVILGPGDAAASNIAAVPTPPNPFVGSIGQGEIQIPGLTKGNNATTITGIQTGGTLISAGGPGGVGPQAARTFITTQGAIFDEQGSGSVAWLSLGPNPPLMPIVIGGTMTNVTANNYFSTDRGAQSIQYLINKARALVRWRSRCVTVSWDAPFDFCVGISGIMNATIYDPRIPGGVATGKVKAYTLSCNEDGEVLGHIEAGVAVGYGNSVPDISGTPEYTAATGYMEPGYQLYDGGQYALAEEDIAYTPISWGRYDDGLNFPLQFFPGTMTFSQPSLQAATLALQMAQNDNPQLDGSIGFVLSPTSGQINPNNPITAWGVPGSSATTPFENTSVVSWLQGGQGTYLLEAQPVSAEVLIQPVDNGPFNGAFYVTCTELEIPMGVDLAAASSG
jgi:hypothetical protein